MGKDDRPEAGLTESDSDTDALESEDIDEITGDGGGLTDLTSTRRTLMSGLAGLGILGGVGSAGASSGESLNTLQTALELGQSYSTDQIGLELNNTSGSGFAPGMRAISQASGSPAFFAVNQNGTGGNTKGVVGRTRSPDGTGVLGQANASTGNSVGLLGVSLSPSGTGLQGEVRVNSGNAVGLRGRVTSPDGTAVLGNADVDSGVTYGVQGQAPSPSGFGLYTPDDAKIDGDLVVQGTKDFAQPVQTPSGSRVVRYTAVEAGQAHTEVNDVVDLEDGRAEIELPEHFQMVTSEDKPLTVQLTPYASEQVHPQVVERSLERIVVEDFADGLDEYAVAYTVKGIRDGFEDQEVVR